jgi:membrane protein implicated in regulation of membrane protease activity
MIFSSTITNTEKQDIIKGKEMPMDVTFIDNWMWLIFVAIGLVLILLELIVGIETGLDMVFVGSAAILGGLITMVLHSWVWTAVITAVIALLYVVIGRRYIHRKIYADAEKTNIDTIIGKTGVVRQEISRDKDGLVKVGNEDWRARSEALIKTGEEITVTGVSGVTLNVKKIERGTQ